MIIDVVSLQCGWVQPPNDACTRMVCMQLADADSRLRQVTAMVMKTVVQVWS